MNPLILVASLGIVLMMLPAFAFAQTDNSQQPDNSGSGSPDNSGSRSSGSTDSGGSSNTPDQSQQQTPDTSQQQQQTPDTTQQTQPSTSTPSCNPNDPNPPASCNKPVQPDSTGAYPSGTVVSGTGVHCPTGTISKHGFCQTQAQQDKNIAISKQRGCNIIGTIASALPPGVSHAVNGFNNRLNGCTN